jgi:hypothetical protein
LESRKLEQLSTFLERRKVTWVTDLRVRASDGVFLATVPTTAIASRASKGKTSPRQLRTLQRSIRDELGVHIEFLVAPSREHIQLEDALRSLVTKQGEGQIENCFLSVRDEKRADIWMELSRDSAFIGSDTKCTVEDLTQKLLSLYGLHVGRIDWGAQEEEPLSTAAILRTVKTLAPIKIAGLHESLANNGFTVPSLDWLNKKLDLLRKHGAVTRHKDGSYVLTETGLGLVPHGAYRNSSDIERALALARRKW